MRRSRGSYETLAPMVVVLVFGRLDLLAASNSVASTNGPSLSPIHPELPPGFWERYGMWILIGVPVLIAVAVAVIWSWRRSRAETTIAVPDAVRGELRLIPSESCDAVTLSRISRLLRRYLAFVFDLPGTELTTAECCALVKDGSALGPAGQELCDFLRECDALKFDPQAGPMRGGLVDRALALFEAAEKHRTSRPTSTGVPPPEQP